MPMRSELSREASVQDRLPAPPLAFMCLPAPPLAFMLRERTGDPLLVWATGTLDSE